MVRELESKRHYDEPHIMHHDSMHTQHKYILSGQNDMMALNNADDSRVTMSHNHCKCGGASGRVASGGRLSGGRLSGGRLSGGRLSGGHLSGGHLSGGRLSGGHLSGGRLSGGHLSGGQLKRGNLVKEVMKKYGLNLGQASKYIKENSL
jgi:uncharacterized protein YjbI with pentapeptide repeats